MEENMEEQEIKDPAGLLAAYTKAKEDLVNLRNENKRLKAEASAATDDNEWKKRALSAETKLALSDQGIKNVDRLLPYVGTDGLDFDEKGAVVGLDERLKALKADLPELFDVKKRVGGNGDIFADTSTETKQDPFRAAVHNALNK